MPGSVPWLLAAGSVLAYLASTLPLRRRAGDPSDAATDTPAAPAAGRGDWRSAALLVGWAMHLGLLLLDIGGWGQQGLAGARLGFAPVLSVTVWLVLTVHALDSRLAPPPGLRRMLAGAGIVAVLLTWAFPGEIRSAATPTAALHFALGVASYGLFGVAVLHGLLLDAAERRLRNRQAAAVVGGMPLLQLERLTFRFVGLGFAVLTLTLALGLATSGSWNWGDRKTVLSVLGWAVFASLLAGRHWRGWRGRRATRWLYAGALLLLLAYAGSRFVLEVVLGRGA